MRKTLLGVCCLAALFSACKEDKSPIDYFPKEYKLKGHVYGTDIIDTSPAMFTFDTLLVTVSNRLKDGIINVFSIPGDMKKIASYGHIGRGPGEFLLPELTSSEGNRFVIHNLNMQQVVSMEVVNDGGEVGVMETERLDFKKMIHENMAWEDRYVSRIGDNYVALTRKGPHEFFSLYDSAMNFLDFFGDNPIGVALDPLSYARFLHGCLGVKNDKMYFALSNQPVIVGYEIVNGVPRKLWEDTYCKSFYEVVGTAIRFDKNRTKGFNEGVFVGNKYVYILFLDMAYGERDYTVAEKSIPNIVLVFDHDGNRIARLNLDHRITRLCVDENETRIYGQTTTEDRIVSFDIPDLSK